VDLILGHRQQDLPCTAQFAELGEDQAHGFLDPQIGIEAKTDLAMPEIADRQALSR